MTWWWKGLGMDLRADKKSLRSLLSVDEQQFRIPPYQRPYSWTFEQVDDLWDDLLENIATGHFLGSVVMSTANELRPIVIDGQQRLTTLMLLMSALRDECTRRGMQRPAQRIDRRLVADELADGDSYFKFKTGRANWSVFRDFVLRPSGDPGRKDDPHALDRDVRARNRPLLDNLARLRSHLAGKLESLPEAQRVKWLEEFDRALVQNTEFVVIEVRDLADAFLLFETLNDRGLQLSAADLLKSHLLGEIATTASDEDVDEAAAEWEAMLEDLGAQVDVTRFLRHYLLGSLPKVRKDDVFGHFKQLVAEKGASWVLEDLRRSARFYGEFENPQKVSHEPTRRVLADLQTLRAVTCYIALLPARRYLSESDFLDYARLTEILTFRYSSVVGLGTNDLERKYHDAAKVLHESAGAELEKSRQILISAMPDAEQFRVAFERLTMGRQYLLRYTLRKIEEHLTPTKEKEIKTGSLVHIEHVMPQKLTDAWRAQLGVDASRHGEYLNRWGNLTLFYAGLNIPASNKTFEEKKAYYKESQVELTQRLCKETAWGPAQIETRQRWLADVAEGLWRVGAGSGPAPASRPAREAFEAQLGALWPAVEPFLVETTTEEVKAMAEKLPGHLVAHSDHGPTARHLGRQLEHLLSRWETYDAAERSVLRAAIAYFLEPDDAVPDHVAGGLADDAAVVGAAATALGGPEDAVGGQP